MINSLPSVFGALSDQTCTPDKAHNFFSFPRWYEFLSGQPDGLGGCTPAIHKLTDIWLIVLAVGQILLTLAGMLAVIYIIYAGFNYTMSQGDPEKTKNARAKILNALIGLVIVVLSAAAVRFVGDQLGGSGTSALGLPQVSAGSETIRNGLNVALEILGAVAFLMIVLSGLSYITARGEPDKMGRARSGIIYSAVGLAVAVFASALVNFVLFRLK